MTIGKRQAVLAVIAEHPDRRPPSALSSQIGTADDARFARAVIADLADRFGKPEAACSLLWCVPPQDAADFAEVTGGAGEIAAVPATDTGARWNGGAQAAFDRGFTHVALMALDAPHVPNDVVYSALGQVDQYGLAFGAGDRGTIYLAAINAPTELFSEVDFAGDDAATDLLVAASKRGLSCAPLVGNFSVRDAADIGRLAAYFGRHKVVESKRTQIIVGEIRAADKVAASERSADHKGRPHSEVPTDQSEESADHKGRPHSEAPTDHSEELADSSEGLADHKGRPHSEELADSSEGSADHKGRPHSEVPTGHSEESADHKGRPHSEELADSSEGSADHKGRPHSEELAGHSEGSADHKGRPHSEESASHSEGSADHKGRPHRDMTN